MTYRLRIVWSEVDNSPSGTVIDSSLHVTAQKYRSSQPRSVFTTDQIGYIFYVDSDGLTKYSKTTNGGTTWAAAVTVSNQASVVDVSVWYDRWTPGDTTGNNIYIYLIDANASTYDIWSRRQLPVIHL